MYVELGGLKPCQQRWDRMKPVPGGRLCGACDRRIIDFRKHTDVEIALAHVRSSEPVCGLYSDPQLARMGLIDSPPPPPPRRLPILALGASLLGTAAHAQAVDLPPAPAGALPRPSAHPASDRRAEASVAAPDTARYTIRGTVRDNGTGAPLADAIVWVEGSLNRGARTDATGAYRLELSEEARSIVISGLGYHRRTIRPRWTSGEIVLDVVLPRAEIALSEFYVSGPPSRWQRIRAAVGRLF